MKTIKNLSISGDFEELKKKVVELTKDNFSWSIEYENEETEDMETLILCDFVYREDPFGEGGLLQAKASFDSHLDKQYEKDAMVYIDFFAFDSLKEEGVIDIETEDSQIFLAFYTLFTEMKLL
jgi:hypothetical protein